MASRSEKTTTLDALDRRVLHALRMDGRVPFRRIAEVLGASEQTIARRYRRMREAGVVRVLLLPTVTTPGVEWWLVRIGVRPGAATALADAIARRPDTSWVNITSGGSEIVCVTRPGSTAQRDALLLDRLPRTNQVTSIVSHAILRSFASDPLDEWTAFDDPLSEEELAALWRPPAAVGARAPLPIEPSDEPMLRVLREDGRAGYAQLAAATGWSAARVARRLEALIDSGAIFIDVDLANELLGFPILANLWMTVSPAELDSVGRRVARLPATAYAGAITGPANLMASVVCRDTAELYEYVSKEIGAIDAVRGVESSLVLRRVKQAGTIMEGSRLPRP
jgi:DNA-binding Lrp family transcriptional regulator